MQTSEESSTYQYHRSKQSHNGLTLQLDGLDRVVLLLYSEQLQVGLVDLLRSVQSVDLAAEVGALVLPMELDLHTTGLATVPWDIKEVLTSATLYKFF